MTYYPVVIPTLNRYKHFKRCVESLARNTHADKTELVIGLDYPPSEQYLEGYEQIKAYIPTISGFRNVAVFERKKNYGALRNLRDLIEYSYKKYDAVIMTEDDNEFSPCFLDFMNKCLEKFRNNDKVVAIGGWNDIKLTNIVDGNIFFVAAGNAWGLGNWKAKQHLTVCYNNFGEKILHSIIDSFQIFKASPALLRMLIGMTKKGDVYGDCVMSCRNILENRYQVRPNLSMVRNWGHDGSGLHCGMDSRYLKQEIDNSKTFVLDDMPVCEEKKIRKILCKSLLPENKFKAYLEILRIVFQYLKYRVSN